MRIANNITALSTYNAYTKNNSNIAKSVKKLSTGYQINSAADNAAGLAISEKMRAQIRGLNQASKNSQDAISLVQTAEGALQSTHDILQRMRELAVQSASDTNEQTIDRAAIQAEFKQLQTEINDIASKTRFNDQNLLDGTFAKYSITMGGSALGTVLDSGYGVRASSTGEKYGTYAITAALNTAVTASTIGGTNATMTVTPGTGTSAAVATMDAVGLPTSSMNGNTYTVKVEAQGDNKVIFNIQDSDGNTVYSSNSIDLSDWDKASGATNKVNIDGFGTLTFTNAASTTITVDQIESDLLSAEFTGSTIAVADGVDSVVTEAKAASVDLTIGGETVNVKTGDTSVTFRSSGITLYFDGGLRDTDIASLVTDLNAKNVVVSALKGNSLIIQSGANEGDETIINIDKMNTIALGVDGSSVSTQKSASKAITEVNDAINKVSTQRSALGALQNRLEFKISNLDTSAENLTSAESLIRDVDMAKEMTAFTNANILQQAATAMLAQANALPQNVLSLLG